MQNKADIRTDEFSGIRCIFGQATKLVELVFDLKTDPYCVLDGFRICPRKKTSLGASWRYTGRFYWPLLTVIMF